MHRARGLRIRRRLVEGWRQMLSGRSTHYSLLEPVRSPFHETKTGPTMGSERFALWGRCLKRRLKTPEPTVGGEGEKRPPKGHLVVYVGGGEMGKVGPPPQRCVVPVVYFNHPLFAELLREVEEEFGFGQVGGITIPCSVSRFERVKERIAGDTAGGRAADGGGTDFNVDIRAE